MKPTLDIRKGLAACAQGGTAGCTGCPYQGTEECVSHLSADALALIQWQDQTLGKAIRLVGAISLGVQAL